jgi:predicted outer membrane repeat protein
MTTSTEHIRVASTLSRNRFGAAAISVATLVATGIHTPAAVAANLSVCPSGCTYATVQGAIDNAGAGDTILIGQGHYFETLNTQGKQLTLQGVGDRRKIIIDGNGKGSVITIPGTKLVAMSDLTITRGFGAGGGISVSVAGAPLSVRHSIIVSNHSTTSGGGIYSEGNVTIVDCNIADNDAAFGGGGLADAGEGVILDIRDSTFARNSAGSGGAISVTLQSTVVNVDHTDIVSNTAQIGGGLFISTDNVPVILNLTNSAVSRNSATQADGGGLYLFGSGLASSHSVFAQNTAAVGGGAIAIVNSLRRIAGASFNDTYIIMNRAGTDGGGVSAPGASISSSTDTVVADNTPDNCPASQSACP